MFQRNVRTGRPKTSAMLDEIRANKYDNPMAAFLAMDDTPDARTTWAEIITADLSFCHYLLATMTETDKTWAVIAYPAAWATARVIKHLKALRRTRRDDGRTYPERGTGGGEDTARTPQSAAAR